MRSKSARERRVRALKIIAILVIVLWAGSVTWRLGELQQLAATACSDARHANVVLQAQRSQPKVQFSSAGCDYGYILWWFSPPRADRNIKSN